MSSYRRPCRECGQKISLRQMPAGHWVAFDVSTETQHKCGKKTKENPTIKKLAQNKKREVEDELIDIGYEQNEISVVKNLNKSIKDKKRLDISYQSYNSQITSRQVSPVKKFKYQGEDYLQAYCHLRNDERNFKIDSIIEATISKKNAFKSKKIGKPNLKDYLEKLSPEIIDDMDYTQSKNLKVFQDDLNKTKGGLDKVLIVIFIWFIIGTTLSYLFG